MEEIERKFLVKNTLFINQATKQYRIVQAYINSNPERTVRVRIRNDKAYLTIKGIGNLSGTTRLEWEKEILLSEAEALLSICEEGVIDKIRYEIPFGNHTYEVDVFANKNQGLVVAEIELKTENAIFEKPSWLGKEVTGDNKYYNAYLSKNPFTNW